MAWKDVMLASHTLWCVRYLVNSSPPDARALTIISEMSYQHQSSEVRDHVTIRRWVAWSERFPIRMGALLQPRALTYL